MPSVAAHALVLNPYGDSATQITTPALSTPGGGATIVISTGRGTLAGAPAPTDNFGNTFTQLGASHTYTMWPSSGTGLYAANSATGGAGHLLTTTVPNNDEVTLGVVVVRNGGTIQAFEWNEVAKGNALTSKTVTTTGPATLIAYWWGDGDVGFVHQAVPNNGFQVLDSVLRAGALVQLAVATREVAAAGTYNVTWDSGGLEGAQLWLVAVQHGP